MATIGAKKKAERFTEQRHGLWPSANEDDLWIAAPTGKGTGYAQIPRAMPILLRILDGWCPKGLPVSTSYLALWSRDTGYGFVNIGSEEEMAYESGFGGNRPVYLWKQRMKLLKDMGFIENQAGAKGEWSHVLLKNPFALVRSRRPMHPVPDKDWNALITRLIEVGATDLASAPAAT